MGRQEEEDPKDDDPKEEEEKKESRQRQRQQGVDALASKAPAAEQEETEEERDQRQQIELLQALSLPQRSVQSEEFSSKEQAATMAQRIAHTAADAARRRSSKLLQASLEAFDDDLVKAKEELLVREQELESISSGAFSVSTAQLGENLQQSESNNHPCTKQLPEKEKEAITTKTSREKELEIRNQQQQKMDRLADKQHPAMEGTDTRLAAKLEEMEATKKAFSSQEQEFDHVIHLQEEDKQKGTTNNSINEVAPTTNSTRDDTNSNRPAGPQTTNADTIPPPPPVGGVWGAIGMPSLQRATGRDLLPPTQPGAVPVRPTQFANDTNNVEHPTSPDEPEPGSSSTSHDDSLATPELSSSLDIPQATPIRASLVRQEEESHQELERLQREMAAKQQEMMEMQRKLQSMERMKLELQNLKAGTVATVVTAEPVDISSTTSSVQISIVGDEKTMKRSHSKDQYEKQKQKQTQTRPAGMSAAEFHAYQILIGSGSTKGSTSSKKDSRKTTASTNSRGLEEQQQDPPELFGNAAAPQQQETTRAEQSVVEKQKRQSSNNSNGNHANDINHSNSNPTDPVVAEAAACCVIL